MLGIEEVLASQAHRRDYIVDMRVPSDAEFICRLFHMILAGADSLPEKDPITRGGADAFPGR
jgi:hypothetical protein